MRASFLRLLSSLMPSPLHLNIHTQMEGPDADIQKLSKDDLSVTIAVYTHPQTCSDYLTT